MLFSACCFSAFSNHLLFVIMPSVTFNSNAENFNRMPLLWPGVMTYIIITKRMVKGPELFGEPFFLPFCFFLDFLLCPFSLLFAAFWSWKLPFQRHLQVFGIRTSHFPWYLQHFGAICSILELEAAISTVFATFLSLNLSFSMVFAIICSMLVLELFM